MCLPGMPTTTRKHGLEQLLMVTATSDGNREL